MAPEQDWRCSERTLTIVFRLDCARTVWGETLAIVGECTGLGSWKTKEAVALTTDSSRYPSWSSPEEVVLKASECLDEKTGEYVVRYKYVLDRRGKGADFQWESIANRELRLLSDAFSHSWLVVDDTFDQHTPPAVYKIDPELSHYTHPRQISDMDDPECTPEPCALEANDKRNSLVRRGSFGQHYRLLGSGPFQKGGFGAVWRCEAHGNDSQTTWAVKRLCKAKMNSREAMVLLGRGGSSEGEMWLHGSLRHPNVVCLREAFDDLEYVSLVMELCQGGDLLDHVQQHAKLHNHGLFERDARAVAAQLFSALSYLHHQRIVHRDVKCENVFVLEQNGSRPLHECTFKLGDFGFARKLLPDEVLLIGVGSRATCAPEVLLGRPYALPADVWSGGALLFMALSAQRPFPEKADGVDSRTTGSVRTKGKIWECVSEDAKALLADITRPKPEERPDADAVLAMPWLS